MPWPKLLSSGSLVLLACLLAAANIWFAAARSTIPLRLSDKILGKEIRREKHQGRDDVHLLHLERRGQVQVDREIFESVQVGQTLQKEGWSHELKHGDQIVTLHWSQDYRGLLRAMPGCLAVLIAMAVCVLAGGSASPIQLISKPQPALDLAVDLGQRADRDAVRDAVLPLPAAGVNQPA